MQFLIRCSHQLMADKAFSTLSNTTVLPGFPLLASRLRCECLADVSAAMVCTERAADELQR